MKKEIKEFCEAHNLTVDQFHGTAAVGGPLDLSGLTSTPEGFNPTVGGGLDLSGLTSIPEGFNPTVGGCLYLKNEVLAICSDIGLLSWQDGKYILIDGILGEVVSRKKSYWKLKKIGQGGIFYATTDGAGYYAHGETIKKANEDLRFKIVAEKIKKEPINSDTLITVDYYRALTGACEMGVAQFKAAHELDKDSYPAAELLPILESHNAYGLDAFRKLATF